MMRYVNSIIRNISIFFYLALFLTFAPINQAPAEVTRMVVKSSGPMGTYGTREYIWVKADMYGSVQRESGETGQYRVPVLLMYPDRDPNGFGFLDLINSSAYGTYKEGEAPEGKRTVYYIGEIIFSDYLRRQGFVYIAPQWARRVTYALGPDYGIIGDGRDGYVIIKDAVDFLKKPIELEGEVAFQPVKVERVVGFGHSQTGGMLREWMRAGLNRKENESLVFDGIIASAGGGECDRLNNDDTPVDKPGMPKNPRFDEWSSCDDPLPEDGKYIAIETQSDLEWGVHRVRHQTSGYRQYELAGVTHIPPDLIDLRLAGSKKQNPISYRPFYVAMLRNLVEWITDGKSPPESQYVEGTVDSDNKFQIALDADGNAKGGVRLPHMARVLDDGKPAGAPLGVYTGIDPNPPDQGFSLLAGTFDPFLKEALAKRYPNTEVYVDLVTKAADALLAEQLILEEDHAAYIKAAKRWR